MSSIACTNGHSGAAMSIRIYSYIKGEPPEHVRASIERGEALFTVKHDSCWGLSPRGRDMMSDECVRSRLKEIMATDDFRRATKDLG